MTISNAFGNITVNFCSNVLIQSMASLLTNKNPYCNVQTSNVNLFLNNQVVQSTFKMSKGILNNLSINFRNCSSNDSMPSLSTYWVINRISSGIDYPISRYCFVLQSSNQLEIVQNDLDFGNYNLAVYAFDQMHPENFASFANYLVKVDTSPISVYLNGGITSLELNWNESLYLDYYSNTYDPDLSNRSDKSDIKFFFVCVSNFELEYIVKQQIMNHDLTSIASELNLIYFQSDWLYFYENDCFFK